VACYLVKYREDFTFTSSLRMRLWCGQDWSEIWGFHGGKDSSRSLLGCDDVWCCGRSHRFGLKIEVEGDNMTVWRT
jgi:hypothetical protein